MEETKVWKVVVYALLALIAGVILGLFLYGLGWAGEKEELQAKMLALENEFKFIVERQKTIPLDYRQLKERYDAIVKAEEDAAKKRVEEKK